MSNNLIDLVKQLKLQGYKQVSLPELAWHSQLSVSEVAKEAIAIGLKVEGGLVMLGGTPTAAHFHKLPQPKTAKVLKQ